MWPMCVQNKPKQQPIFCEFALRFDGQVCHSLSSRCVCVFCLCEFHHSGGAMANPNDGDDHAKLVELQGLFQRAQEVE